MPTFTVTFRRTTRDKGTFTVRAATDKEACRRAHEVFSNVIGAGAEEDIALCLHEHNGAITDTDMCREICAVQ